MADLSFCQQLTLTIIDKAVIGGLLGLAAYGFSRLLEAFKADQTLQLEQFKAQQADHLETTRAESAKMIELLRTQLSRETVVLEKLNEAIAEVARRLAAGSHSICWLCWIAKFCPKDLTTEHLTAYDKEMNEILSQLVGARVVLTALSPQVHTTLSPLIQKLYALDVEVGNAKALYSESREQGIVALGRLHQASQLFDDELLKAVTSLSQARSVSA